MMEVLHRHEGTSPPTVVVYSATAADDLQTG